MDPSLCNPWFHSSSSSRVVHENLKTQQFLLQPRRPLHWVNAFPSNLAPIQFHLRQCLEPHLCRRSFSIETRSSTNILSMHSSLLVLINAFDAPSRTPLSGLLRWAINLLLRFNPRSIHAFLIGRFSIVSLYLVFIIILCLLSILESLSDTSIDYRCHQPWIAPASQSLFWASSRRRIAVHPSNMHSRTVMFQFILVNSVCTPTSIIVHLANCSPEFRSMPTTQSFLSPSGRRTSLVYMHRSQCMFQYTLVLNVKASIPSRIRSRLHLVEILSMSTSQSFLSSSGWRTLSRLHA